MTLIADRRFAIFRHKPAHYDGDGRFTRVRLAGLGDFR